MLHLSEAAHTICSESLLLADNDLGVTDSFPFHIFFVEPRSQVIYAVIEDVN